MKASGYLKVITMLVGVFALALILFTSSSCLKGECRPIKSWSLPSDLGRMLGFYDDVELPDEVNILVIGIDSREGSGTVHCDAIHLVHIDLVDETMEFVNVPRGTYSYIPGYPPNEQYISNVCEYLDVNTFVERVDKITGYKTDFRVLVGFSQAQGVLRALRFDPTTTLQYLRHRQSYAIGDVQRSYNQSVFMSDLVLNKLDTIQSIPAVARFALFKLVDTDMPHSYADALFSWLKASAIPNDASRISHTTKPNWSPVATEMHFNEEQANEQLDTLYSVLKYYKPNFSVTNIQPTLIDFIDENIASSYFYLISGDITLAEQELNKITEQQLWHQIEDNQKRLNVMVSVAILDSTIKWYGTFNQDSTLKLATSIMGLMELEENPDAHINRIKEHLTELLKLRT